MRCARGEVARRSAEKRSRRSRFLFRRGGRPARETIADAEKPECAFGLFGPGFFIQFAGRGIDRPSGAGVLWAAPTLGYDVFALSARAPGVDATRPPPCGTVPVLLLLTFAPSLAAVLSRGRLRAHLPGRT